MIELLDDLGLMDRYLDTDEERLVKRCITDQIVWDAVFKKLDELRNGSVAYLKCALAANDNQMDQSK